jgi:hypothetical protein
MAFVPRGLGDPDLVSAEALFESAKTRTQLRPMVIRANMATRIQYFIILIKDQTGLSMN